MHEQGIFFVPLQRFYHTGLTGFDSKEVVL